MDKTNKIKKLFAQLSVVGSKCFDVSFKGNNIREKSKCNSKDSTMKENYKSADISVENFKFNIFPNKQQLAPSGPVLLC